MKGRTCFWICSGLLSIKFTMLALIAVRSVSEILFGSSSTFGKTNHKHRINQLSAQVNKADTEMALFTLCHPKHYFIQAWPIQWVGQTIPKHLTVTAQSGVLVMVSCNDVQLTITCDTTWTVGLKWGWNSSRLYTCSISCMPCRSKCKGIHNHTEGKAVGLYSWCDCAQQPIHLIHLTVSTVVWFIYIKDYKHIVCLFCSQILKK